MFSAIWTSTLQGQAISHSAEARFEKDIFPILKDFCLDCHSGDAKEGGVQFDGMDRGALIGDQKLWLNVLRNIRADMMPPQHSEQPSPQAKSLIASWIHSDAFQVNAEDPYPGRAPIRRLNRGEYRNTVRDLTGVDFNAEVVFPPDDTGFGFDNISEAMTISPMLLEKYLQAAKTISDESVPISTWVMPSQTWFGKELRSKEEGVNGARLRHDKPTTVVQEFQLKHQGLYRIRVHEKLDGSFEFHPGRYRITCKLDGKELYVADYAWEDDRRLVQEFSLEMTPGAHQITSELATLSNETSDTTASKDQFALYVIESISVDGPSDETLWEHPAGYDRFFHKPSPPTDEEEKRRYAKEVLMRFATRAYRRPPSDSVCDRLVAIAEAIYSREGHSFEEGIKKAIMAVLASPNFLFRVEDLETLDESSQYPKTDEYALATNLSYLLWSTMPDAQLFELADQSKLRSNFSEQLQRMIRDERSNEFMESFVGQWLRARDVENVSIDPIAAMGHQKEFASLRERFAGRRRASEGEPSLDPESEKALARFRELGSLRDNFNAEIRSAMRKETEMSFSHIVREDRSLLELIDADYVFINDVLAKVYSLPPVNSKELNKVSLPAGSARGGILTQGAMLTVTSNPTRTSPVKRGLFILDNILGTPAPPAPPNVPALEDAADRFGGREPSLRELLAAHREAALCSSCHSRMDPLGLALENFNAIGAWRELESEQPIESAGELITGEKFANVQELKQILVTSRRKDFYRCVTEKLLIYALGRGLEVYDETTVDKIVDQLDRENGKFSVLLEGVVLSAAFQRRAMAAMAE